MLTGKNQEINMAFIGSEMTYHGTEHPYLRANKVQVIGVMKNGADPNIDHDGPEYAYITTEEELVSAGGVGPNDRVEVRPWLPSKDRWSFVTSDPLFTDLREIKA